jgi:VWFA-related protein
MRRVIWWSVVVIGIALLGVGTAAAQTGIDVIVNDVEAEALEGGTAYEVTAYVTVADAGEQPVTTLSVDDFSVSQDGEDVALSSAAIVQRSATIVLALDTSGSMADATTIAAVRQAASRFVTGLGPQDQVGIIYFNDEIVVAQSLSDDLQAAGTIVNLVEAESGAGTCLYDAAYEAVVMASAAPPGQRAVVLLTDGVDELPNNAGLCSTHTLDDVTGLATEGGIHVPIYTIGLGERIDASELNRIAERTGGDALIAPGPADVDALFQTIAAQLRNQYALVYTTTTTSGEHALTVIASADGVTGVGTGRFVTPAHLSLTGLDEGALLEGARTVRATASGEAALVRVQFAVDGLPVGEASAPPFEIALDGAALPPGAHALTVVATLDDGSELVATLDFEVPSSAVAVPEAPPAGESTVESAEESALSSWQWLLLPLGGGTLLVVGLAGVIVLIAARRRSQTPPRSPLGPSEEVTMIESLPPEDAATGIRPIGLPATLSVAKSPGLVPDQSFDLSRSLTRLGRSRMNDVIVSDPSVSRRHAEIRYTSGGFWVHDLGSSFGTFVNSDRVGMEGRQLRNGDRLQLGPQTTFVVHIPLPSISRSEPTQVGRGASEESDSQETQQWPDEGTESNG